MQLHGVGKITLDILRIYWRNLEIMLIVNGKKRKTFKTQKGIIQGDPLSLFLFNIMIDCMIQNLINTFPEIDKNLDYKSENLISFYEDDGMISGIDKSNLETRMDKISNILTNLGLSLNHEKTVWMATFPPLNIRWWSDEAYSRYTDRKLNYKYKRNINQALMNCNNRIFWWNIPTCTHICNYDTEFLTHQYNKHVTLVEEANSIFRKGDEIKQVSWTDSRKCPIESCQFLPKNEQQLIQHCDNQHMFTTIQRENFRHCEYCHILKRYDSIWDRHNRSKACAMSSEPRALIHEMMIMELDVKYGISLHNTKLTKVRKCKYLGRIVTDDHNDFLSLRRNMINARICWCFVKKLIWNFDGISCIMKKLYCGAVLPVLLYGAETWHLNSKIKILLISFHNNIAREINRRAFIKRWTRNRKYEDIEWSKMREHDEDALGYVRLRTIKDYWNTRLGIFSRSSLGCARNKLQFPESIKIESWY